LGFPKHTALIFLIFLLVMSRRLCFHQQTLCNSAALRVYPAARRNEAGIIPALSLPGAWTNRQTFNSSC